MLIKSSVRSETDAHRIGWSYIIMFVKEINSLFVQLRPAVVIVIDNTREIFFILIKRRRRVLYSDICHASAAKKDPIETRRTINSV